MWKKGRRGWTKGREQGGRNVEGERVQEIRVEEVNGRKGRRKERGSLRREVHLKSKGGREKECEWKGKKDKINQTSIFFHYR